MEETQTTQNQAEAEAVADAVQHETDPSLSAENPVTGGFVEETPETAAGSGPLQARSPEYSLLHASGAPGVLWVN